MSKHKHYELQGLPSNLSSSQKMGPRNSEQMRLSRCFITLAVITAIVSLACLVAGLILIVRYHNKPCDSPRKAWQEKQRECENCSTAVPITTSIGTVAFIGHGVPTLQHFTRPPPRDDPCDFSAEARRSGLPEFFEKVKDIDSKLQPKVHEPFTFSPQFIKEATDRSSALFVELNNIHVNENMLTLRESRMLAQMRHFLKHNFGNPYVKNYYTGAWMLGPNTRAWRSMCNAEAIYLIPRFFRMIRRPVTLEDVENVLKLFESVGQSTTQYETNVRMGVQVGMVRSLNECEAGIDCLLGELGVKTFKSDTHILSSDKIPLKSFLSRVSSDVRDQWKKKHFKSITSSLNDALVVYIGRPLAKLFNYLEEHKAYCLPKNVVWGMGTRPVDFVFYQGVKTANRTSKRLPTGELINGTISYNQVLAYITTIDDMTAEHIHNLGWKILNETYGQAEDVAMKWVNTDNVTKAVLKFELYLNDTVMYFNSDPFPQNESYEEAHEKCFSYDTAKEYCPVRHAVMEKWLDYARSTMSTLQARLYRAFHTQPGPKKTTPTCPVRADISFSTNYIVPVYSYIVRKCLMPARYRLPFFADRMGPKMWSETGHEVFPGHHLQLKGFFDNFWTKCKNDIMSRTEYFVFKEGWATYAEDPVLRRDLQGASSFPKLDLVQEYGVIRSMIWRALRMVIDTGLHSKRMSNIEIVQLYQKYLWLIPKDVIHNEIDRSSRDPGSLTAYMIGRQFLVQLRNKAETALGRKQFNLKDFHYHILSQGPTSTLPDVQSRIDKYVRCTKNPLAEGCQSIIL